MSNTNGESFDRMIEDMKAQMERKTLMNWAIRRQQRYERSLVEGDRSARRDLFWRDVVGLVAVMAALLLLPWALPGVGPLPELVFLAALTLLAVGAMHGVMGARRRAFAYRTGWLAGRTDMIMALRAADEQGMSRDEFETAELLRSLNVL